MDHPQKLLKDQADPWGFLWALEGMKRQNRDAGGQLLKGQQGIRLEFLGNASGGQWGHDGVVRLLIGFPLAPGQQRNFKLSCLRWRSVVTPDGTGTPSGSWTADSSVALWNAVLSSEGAVTSSPQAPYQTGRDSVEHTGRTNDYGRSGSVSDEK